MKTSIIICLSVVFLSLASATQAVEITPESNIRPRLSTDEVENQITLDRKANPLYESRPLAPLRDWRDGVAEKTGLNWGLDYTALFMGVCDSPGEDDASSGMVRSVGARAEDGHRFGAESARSLPCAGIDGGVLA